MRDGEGTAGQSNSGIKNSDVRLISLLQASVAFSPV